jgi:hypothetical protein
MVDFLDYDNIYLSIMEQMGNGALDLAVFPIPSIQLSSVIVADKHYKFSETVGYFSLGHIGFVSRPGVRPKFYPEVWIALLITLLTVCCQMFIIRGNVNTFFYAFWQFSTILLSDYMTIIAKTIHEKIIIFFWQLIAGIVLFVGFYDFKTSASENQFMLHLHRNWKVVFMMIGWNSSSKIT